MNNHPPPPDVAEAIARLRAEVNYAQQMEDYFCSTNNSDILAVCAASEQAEAELAAWRNGGLTEELLRRQDGCLKLNAGMSVTLDSEWAAMLAQFGSKLTPQEVTECIAQSGEPCCQACGRDWKDHHQRCEGSANEKGDKMRCNKCGCDSQKLEHDNAKLREQLAAAERVVEVVKEYEAGCLHAFVVREALAALAKSKE